MTELTAYTIINIMDESNYSSHVMLSVCQKSI